ncbi:retrovirus-related pol polyprotein from transposon TNT 1-94 [Tanacetum coccineum]|uniref:Retrovirus-related pol polyprotein from transposon TNT 1-94 n=1 Tax=Tanacetum coccineum TaxID=301880 RepID=A0ABQ5D1Z8_9ASTR
MTTGGASCVLTMIEDVEGSGYQQKDRKPSQNDKTEHGMEKTVQNQGQTIATACYNQNRSIIHRRFDKTPYELINYRKLDISFLHVFEALCYPKNDHEDIGKLGAKGGIGFFIGYSATSYAYRVCNRQTKKIMETMNVTFDELSVMAFEQSSLKPGLQSMTSGQISSGLDLTYASTTITTQQPTKVLHTPTTTTTIADTAPTPTNSSSQATNFQNTSQDVYELETQQQHSPNAMLDGNTFVNPFATPSTSAAESSSSQYVDPSNMEVKVGKNFDKLVKQVESFAPINFEATKASLKRFGEELQTKTPKRMKDDEAKDDEPTKKSGKRRKQMARRGLHTDIDKDVSEGSDEVDEQEESVTGTKIPINPVPVAMKTPSIATYKIFKQGEKGAYQIVREDGTDIVYINFGAMLKSISRDDLTELYRIVMNRYGMDGPEDKLEKIFWKYLKDMFEEPLSTDPVWSLLSQQRIISWRYYDTCRVHCLNLESMDIYMLSERKYPLSAEVCQTMLKMKLLDGKMNEDCYKMLKMMEKQAGIRK